MKLTRTLLLWVSVCQVVNGQAALLKLPCQFVEGYGPFAPSFIGVHWIDSTQSNSWAKTDQSLVGIPASWSQVKKGTVWLDAHQLAYQNFKMGKLSEDSLNQLQAAWCWSPNEERLSPNPIRCTIHVLTGIDQSGRRLALIDSNNNLDFSDEQPIDLSIYDQQLSVANTRLVEYDSYRNGQVIKARVNMAVKPSADGITCNFPFYALATFTNGLKKDSIAVVSARFTNPVFRPSSIVNLSDSAFLKSIAFKNTRTILARLMSNEGEYITIQGVNYQYVGLDVSTQCICLKKVDQEDSLYSTQKGYRAPAFRATEFTTGKTISLADYRGKYVLLDFWGTWCKPCLAEMPNLKQAYSQSSRDLIEFIGIVSHDTPKELKTYLEREDIHWPQIQSDQANHLVETYKILTYPTTILIDPEGKVLLTHISGVTLNGILFQLSRLKN